MKKQERIEAAQKRIQELKTLINYWIKKKKMSYVRFKTKGYLPTDLSNWHKKYIGIHSEYGVYVNEDPGIAKCHIAAYKRCGEYKLKEIYEKQGKPYYYSCAQYPNAPFIVFEQKKYVDTLKVRQSW